MDDRVIISLYGNDIIQDMQVVENLFHFQISGYNFSLPLPFCILFVFMHNAQHFTNEPIMSKNSNLDIGKLA